jgi:hypothetical protein
MKIKRWLSGHKIDFHSQNLNEIGSYRDERGRLCTLKGSMWEYGRCWLSFPVDPEYGSSNKTVKFNFNWHFGSKVRLFMLTFDVGGDESDFHLTWAIERLFYFSLGIENIIPRNLKKRWKWWPSWEVRETGIRIVLEQGWIWLDTFYDGSDSSKNRRWQHITLTPLDWLFGKVKHSSEDLSNSDVIVSLPEANYQTKVRMFRSTWKRPRWPRSLVLTRADIEVEGGIPIPGKGENSWDLDDDAVFSLTTPAESVEEACLKLIDDVTGTRKRRGWVEAK